ncbi:hypothetical protein GCM10027517_38130 [Phycicoccus ginsengisoli]
MAELPVLPAAPAVRVRGGVAGTAVELAGVEDAARVLALEGTGLGAVCARLVAVSVDPGLVASGSLAPVSLALAQAALALARRDAGGQAAALLGLSAGAAAAVEAYRATDQAVAATVEAVQDAAFVALVRVAPEITVGLLALHAAGVDVAGAVDEALFVVPGVADVAGGVDGLVEPAPTGPPTGRGLPTQDRPAGDYETALRVLTQVAGVAGLLRESGGAKVTAERWPRAGSRAPDDLTALADDLANLSDAEDYPGHVRVVEVPQAQGGSVWLVEVSGTQSWDAQSGDNPFDVTSDVRLMAGESTALAVGVTTALDQAMAATGRDTSGEPVMLAGHSLGGIVAAGLASSPRFRAAHRVTHVVTMGSPVARMPVPVDVSVLSLEHQQDAVPRLEGQPNPDRRGWVTVTRDLRGGPVRTASGAHATAEYARTAALVDAATDPSTVAWRDGSTRFFARPAAPDPVVRDFRVERLVDPGSAPP